MLSRMLKQNTREPQVKEESKPSEMSVDLNAAMICKQIADGTEKSLLKPLWHAGNGSCLEDEALSPSGSDTTYGHTLSIAMTDSMALPDASWNSDFMSHTSSETGKKSMGFNMWPKIAEMEENDEVDHVASKTEVLVTATSDKLEDLMRSAGSVEVTTAAAAAAANLVTQQRLDQKETQQNVIAGREMQKPVHPQSNTEENDAKSPFVQSPPGLSEVASLPSRGSGTHGIGECSPCVWHWKPQGCLRGPECGYCHLCPEGEVKARKKAKAATLKSTSGKDDETTQEKEQKPLSVNDLDESNEAFVAPAVEPQTFMSIGSSTHGTGQCRPCAWIWKPQGCQNGADCRHCHLCHEGEIKARKKLKAESLRRELNHAPVEAEHSAQLELIDESTAAIPPPPGLPDPDPQAIEGQFSIGSQKHGSGECRPCAWFWKPQGCRNGANCRHCHLCPVGELKVRKKEKADMQWQDRQKEQQAQKHACSEMQLHQASAAQTMNPFCMPLAPPTPLASIGSALHGTGMCCPCAWFWKPQGCGNGMDCCYCHLCPEGEIKARRKMKNAGMRNHGPKDQSLVMSPMSTMSPMSPLGMFWDPMWQSPIHGDSFFVEQQEDDEDDEEGEEEEMSKKQEQGEKEEKDQKGIVGMRGEDSDEHKDEEKMVEAANGEDKHQEHGKTEQAGMEFQAKQQDVLGSKLNGDDSPVFVDMNMLSPFAFTPIPPPMSLNFTSPMEVSLPSAGSTLHALGKCRPCAWMWKPKGCLNGEACAHCHLCPEGELKVRKKVKETAMRRGALVPSQKCLDAQSPRIVKLAARLEA